ncbi:unnamed protein product, partial [Mesorhabditis spiculigera]
MAIIPEQCELDVVEALMAAGLDPLSLVDIKHEPMDEEEPLPEDPYTLIPECDPSLDPRLNHHLHDDGEQYAFEMSQMPRLEPQFSYEPVDEVEEQQQQQQLYDDYHNQEHEMPMNIDEEPQQPDSFKPAGSNSWNAARVKDEPIDECEQYNNTYSSPGYQVPMSAEELQRQIESFEPVGMVSQNLARVRDEQQPQEHNTTYRSPEFERSRGAGVQGKVNLNLAVKIKEEQQEQQQQYNTIHDDHMPVDDAGEHEPHLDQYHPYSSPQYMDMSIESEQEEEGQCQGSSSSSSNPGGEPDLNTATMKGVNPNHLSSHTPIELENRRLELELKIKKLGGHIDRHKEGKLLAPKLSYHRSKIAILKNLQPDPHRVVTRSKAVIAEQQSLFIYWNISFSLESAPAVETQPVDPLPYFKPRRPYEPPARVQYVNVDYADYALP